MIVRVENLSYSYGATAALDAVSFDVPRGALYCVLGPNGCGKSTLFRILATVQSGATGRVEIDGIALGPRTSSLRRRVGVVFQNASTDRRLTVHENLISQGRLYGLSGRALEDKAASLLAQFRLEGKRDAVTGSLSGGQRRRVEIAKALLHEPALLLLDEASTGLDPGARLELWQTLEGLRESSPLSVVFTTHLLDEAERASHILLLNHGRVVCQGSPDELKSQMSGDIVVLKLKDAGGGAAALLEQEFAVQPRRLGNELRIEIPHGHRFLAQAIDCLGAAIESGAVHKPSLEDLFLRETGERLDV